MLLHEIRPPPPPGETDLISRLGRSREGVASSLLYPPMRREGERRCRPACSRFLPACLGARPEPPVLLPSPLFGVVFFRFSFRRVSDQIAIRQTARALPPGPQRRLGNEVL